MSTKLKQAEVDVDALRPNPWNTNVVSPENEKKLRASFDKFGCYKPIIVRETDAGLQILGGEHRWRTARELGYKTVPIVNLGKITDKQAKEIGLVDNGRYGEDDPLQLAELLRGLGDSDDIMSFLPYQNDDLSAIFASTDIDFDSLELPDDDDDRPLELPPTKSSPTHQVMRFKVPLEDSTHITRLIERTMKEQGYTDDDSMSNAGNALVHLLKDL